MASYTVCYSIHMTHDVQIVCPDGLTREEILTYVGRDDLANGDPSDVGWDEVKEAWKSNDVYAVYDEHGDVVY